MSQTYQILELRSQINFPIKDIFHKGITLCFMSLQKHAEKSGNSVVEEQTEEEDKIYHMVLIH